MLKVKAKYIVEIIDFSSNGEGIGKIDGVAVFIPGAIPGDVVLIEVTELKKSFAKAKIINIESSSQGRIDPCCFYADSCGGCSYQHVAYETQNVFKQKWIQDSIERIGGLENPKVLDILTMEEPWRYRNKVQYTVGRISGPEKKRKGCNIGFYQKGSHRIINCGTCLLQAEPAEGVARGVREYIKESKLPIYDPKTGTGVLRGLMVKTAFETGEIMVALISTERKIPDVEVLIDKIIVEIEKLNGSNSKAERSYSLESLILNFNTAKGPAIMGEENIVLAGKRTITDRMAGMDFEISPHSFYQINPVQTEKLYRKVKEYAALTGNETVLDLYCGVGTIGLILANDAKQVIGIESTKFAVMDANRNAVINKIVNAEFICGKAEEELPKLIEQGICADLVILDPPRAGCHPGLLDSVVAAKPAKIIYVSCDPATLARDIKILVQQGYNFIEAQPVDMFPWTRHVETVVLLSWVDKG